MLYDMNCCMMPSADSDHKKYINNCVNAFRKLRADGVENVVLNLSFNNLDETISDYIKRRDMSLSLLNQSDADLSSFKIIKGSVCTFSCSLFDDPDVEKLCIGSTKYIYIEFPSDKPLNPNDIRVLHAFSAKGTYKIVICNVERLLFTTQYELIEKLMRGNILGLVGSSSFEEKKMRTSVLELIKNGYAHLIGSSSSPKCDDIFSIEKAVNFVSKKVSKDVGDRLSYNSKLLLSDANIRDIKVVWGNI